MASLWAARLPIATVPQAAQPKPVTFVYPYYDNPRFFAEQLGHWRAYPADLHAQLTAIVVDDGSPTPAAVPEAPPFPIRLFRIAVDVPWNWLAARNIGAHHAPDDSWLLLTDMDHVVPTDTLRTLIWGQHDPAVVYAFSRREHTGEDIPPHSASFFLTRAMFWTIGGYDETLSGHYGTDGDFRRRVRGYAPIHVLNDVLVRHEYVEDASTSRYRRKLPEDAIAVKRLIAARGPDWRPKALSCPHVEVTC